MSVQSLTRAFDILELIANRPDGIGVTTIADELGLPKSTVSRLLQTLENRNIVQKLPKYGGYQIGPEIVQLAAKSTPQQRLVTMIRPYLQQLTDVTGESALLELQDGWFVHYLAQTQSNHAIRVDDWVGRRHPLHTVTSGILFMSTWTDRALQRYFNRELEQPTAKTITHLEAMKQKISQANQQGYALSIDAFAEGFTGLSAPIYDADDKIMAAINISAPTFRFPQANALERVVERLTAVTESISTQIVQSERWK
ncbi:MAG: IclR family transcriptional regulator [Chloroflexota bacterium]